MSFSWVLSSVGSLKIANEIASVTWQTLLCKHINISRYEALHNMGGVGPVKFGFVIYTPRISYGVYFVRNNQDSYQIDTIFYCQNAQNVFREKINNQQNKTIKVLFVYGILHTVK